MDHSPGNCAEWKKANLKRVGTVWFNLPNIFLKTKFWTWKTDWWFFRIRRWGWREGWCGYTRTRCLWWQICSVSRLWWFIHKPPQVRKLYRTAHTHTHTHTPASKTGEIWTRSEGCLNVNIVTCDMTVVLQNVAIGVKWEKSSQGLFILFLTTACEPTTILLQISMRKIMKSLLQHGLITCLLLSALALNKFVTMCKRASV